MDFFDLITEDEDYIDDIENEKNESKKGSKSQVINEGLVDVMFKTFRTNLKTSVSGSLVYFRWEWVNTKTFFTVRIKKSTLQSLVDWLNGIVDDANGSEK